MFSESNINCFLTLAETLSFKKTACMMSVSQQAVSQIISRMEAKLEVKLFVRSKRHVEITPVGKKFYEFFYRYKEEFDELCYIARTQFNLGGSSLRAGYQNWIDHGVEPKFAIEEIRRIAPDFDVHVTRRSPGGLIEGLLNHELDLAIMYDQFAPELGELRITPLKRMEIEVLVAKDHPLGGPDVTFSAFAREPFIFDVFENETEAAARRRVKIILGMIGYEPSKLVILKDLEAVYNAVERGEGFAISSSISRMVSSYNIQGYPTGVEQELVCAWQWMDGNTLLEKYVEALRKAYLLTEGMGV